MNYFIRRCSITALALVMFFSGLIIRENRAVHTSVNANRTIVIDAGHGEPDGGAMGKSKVKESEINLAVAYIVKKELEESGYSVLMTRCDENAINQREGDSVRNNKRADLKERVRLVNESGAAALVSIHMNYFGEEKSNGPQVFYSKNTDGSEELAQNIRAAFLEEIGERGRREIKPVSDGIYLLKNAKITTVLVECGFLSNHEEEAMLITKEYQEKMGKCIANGIKSYFSEKMVN